MWVSLPTPPSSWVWPGMPPHRAPGGLRWDKPCTRGSVGPHWGSVGLHLGPVWHRPRAVRGCPRGQRGTGPPEMVVCGRQRADLLFHSFFH